MRIVSALLVLAACGVESTNQPPTGVPPGDDDPAQVATRTSAEVRAWLATGEYLTWPCENESHPARPGSGHARNRICNNDRVATTPAGTPFPIGAASVKELLDGSDAIVGYAFAEKARESDGGRGWYWYEVVGNSTYAASYGAPLCTGCHEAAGHDFLFTVVP